MRVASVQIDPELSALPANLEEIVGRIKDIEADLVVFPECALSGYGFESRDAVLRASETIPGPATDALARACRLTGRSTIVGLLERSGEQVYNAAVLIGPEGIAGLYRKAHLPFIGADRFTTPGDLGFPVFETPIGRLGILICYDLSFPEAARSLKLDGAQIICVPTNWPEAAEVSCCHAPIVRAQENHVHVVTCDRVGTETGFTFRGGSRICTAAGDVLALAGREVAVITAELDPLAADQNRVVNVPGQYEIDRIQDRRPELYGSLTVDRHSTQQPRL